MQVDTRQLKDLENKLLKFNRVGLKIAQQYTVNDYAFEARKEARDIINKEFINRNKFTTSARNMPITKASRNNPFSQFGHTQDYMRRQEKGFTKKPDRYTGSIAIPTPVASGERKGGATGKTIRRKPVRKPNRKNMLKMPSKAFKDVPRRQRTLVLIKEAIKTKRRYIEIERNGETNIFRVRGTQKRYQLDRMYKTEHKTIQVRANPWLSPATKRVMNRRTPIYENRLRFQVDRLFKK